MNQITTTEKLRPPKVRLLQEFLLVGLSYLVYSQVRGLAANRVVDAFSNGYRMVRIERSLGIFEELGLQTFVLSHHLLIHFFNIFYFYGLFPLLLPTAIWLFIKRPRVYTLARNAFLLSGGIAACFFLVLPTAPPRLLDVGLIDTLSRSITPSYESIPGVNPYAAVPSMHVGWNFLIAVSLYLALSNFRWRVLILLLPVVMLMATVATGNHYILDGLLGIAVASVGLCMALLIDRRQHRQSSVPAEPELTQAPSSS